MKNIPLSWASKYWVVWVLLCMANAAYALPGLNGISIHSELSQEQFIAALYSDTISTDPRTILLDNGEKVMEVRVLRTIYARKFNRMWVEGLAINAGSSELAAQAQNLADFSNMMRLKLRAGDILRIERKPQQGTLLFINGIELGRIEDPQFFDLLLRAWVGPVPLSSDFKSELLAGGKISEDLFDRYRAVQPSQERVSTIELALAPPQSSSETVSSSSAPTRKSSVALAAASSSSATVVAKASSSSASSQKRLVTEDELFEEEELFDDEDGFAFTAESVLSEQLYISKLTKWTGNYVKYPKYAIRNELEGTVRLTVTINRSGKVVDVQFLEKSRYEHLNKSAYRAVKSASPYPAIPKEIKGDSFIFTVPVVFKIRIEGR